MRLLLVPVKLNENENILVSFFKKLKKSGYKYKCCWSRNLQKIVLLKDKSGLYSLVGISLLRKISFKTLAVLLDENNPYNCFFDITYLTDGKCYRFSNLSDFKNFLANLLTKNKFVIKNKEVSFMKVGNKFRMV